MPTSFAMKEITFLLDMIFSSIGPNASLDLLNDLFDISRWNCFQIPSLNSRLFVQNLSFENFLLFFETFPWICCMNESATSTLCDEKASSTTIDYKEESLCEGKEARYIWTVNDIYAK